MTSPQRRPGGAVRSAAGLVPFGHLGWGYRDRADFLDRAAEYLADGLAHNQRVEYVGDGSHHELLAELAAMPGIAERLGDGAIRVQPAWEFYGAEPDSDIVDPQTAVAGWVAAVEQAIEDGYTGFRAVVDATAVTRKPEGREAFARFEFLIDRVMAAHPVSALCGYDLTELADGAAELICLHPFVNRHSAGFRCYAESGAGYALAGEIDASNDDVFSTVVGRTWESIGGDTVVIDAFDLEFIGHRQLAILDEQARAHGRKVIVRGAKDVLRQVVRLLELVNVDVLPAPYGS